MTEELNKTDVELLHSRIDELRAVVYSLADRLNNSMVRIDAAVSEISASAKEVKSFRADSHKNSIVYEVTDAVSHMFAKHPPASEVAVLFGKEVSKELDAKLASLAQLDAEVLGMAKDATAASADSLKSTAELQKRFDALALEISQANSRISGADEKMAAIPAAVGREVDAKLAKLASLESEMFAKEKANSDALAKLLQFVSKIELEKDKEEIIISALANLSKETKSVQSSIDDRLAAKQDLASAKMDAIVLEMKGIQNRTEEVSTAFRALSSKDEENYSQVHAALHKIVDNQNHVNSVISDSLTAIVEANEACRNSIEEVRQHVEVMRVKFESMMPHEEIEKRVEEKIAKRFQGA